MRGGRTLASLALAAASILVTLGACELLLRALYAGAAAPVDPGPVARLYVPSANPAIVFEHAPGVRVAFPAVAVGERITGPWEVAIRPDGLRSNGAEDLPPGARVGICLGDSTMFGVGLDDDETIPARLGAFLSADLGRPFSCLNFGVANYTTAQEVAFFRHQDGLAFDPAVVVLGVYTNDFKTSPGSVDVVGGKVRLVAPGTSGWLARAFEDLQLVRLGSRATLALRDLLRTMGLYPHANAKPLKPAQIAAVTGALDELRALLAPGRIPLVLVLFPRDWQVVADDREAATERQRVVLDYCREHDVPCVDLLDTFYGREVEDYFRPGDDSHPHAEAANTVARLVADAVGVALESR